MAIIVNESETSTVSDLLTQALQDIGYLGAQEQATSADLSSAFKTFKQMLGQWQIDGLLIHATEQVSFAVTGARSYALGDGAAVDVTRPTEVLAAFYREGSLDEPLTVLDSDEDYQSIGDKSQTGRPSLVWYSPTYPNGTLYVWPVPSSGEIHLTVRQPLPSFTAVANEVSMPPEYQFALRYSLAEVLAASFGMQLRPDIVRFAQRARKLIKRNNLRIPSLQMPAELVCGRFDVVTGE